MNESLSTGNDPTSFSWINNLKNGDDMIEAMTDKVDELLEAMKEDYNAWQNQTGIDDERVAIRKQMEEEYNDGLHTVEGSKYIKVISSTRGSSSVCAFVVNTDSDKKFKFGDILKPAGWAAPARNFSRGNVFEENGFDRIRWTGAG
jgi:hypothetical protein